MKQRLTLTKNEKKTLKLLLFNSRTSDSEIASQLKISSQAVGKIRRKLEETVIRSYSVRIDYAKLGLHIFAIAIAKITPEGLDKGELEMEQMIQQTHNIINAYRLPRGSSTHVLLMGFGDIDQFDDFFHSTQKAELHRYLEIQDIFTFSHNSLIKEDPSDLLARAIEGLNGSPDKRFAALDTFKRRIE